MEAFLGQYVDLVIVGICICTGYVIKTSLTMIPPKYIPLIMLLIGTAASVLSNLSDPTPRIIFTGMVSGLASTGSYEMVHQFIKNRGNNKGAKFIEGLDEELSDQDQGEDDDDSN